MNDGTGSSKRSAPFESEAEGQSSLQEDVELRESCERDTRDVVLEEVSERSRIRSRWRGKREVERAVGGWRKKERRRRS